MDTRQLQKSMLFRGMTETEIRQSWQNGLRDFQQIRKKYLLYAE